ncbi:MAG: hypothetical protein ABIH66_04360 [bacterium]
MERTEQIYRNGAGVTARFYRLLDALEEHLDRGFFLSFIGKIVVDEKKIYSLLNELRALTPEAVRNSALRSGGTQAGPVPRPETEHATAPQAAVPGDALEEARRVREGADKYACDVLKELEGHLQSISEVVQHGRDVLKKRMQEQEVK